MKNYLHKLFLSLAVLLAMPMMAAVEVEIDGINYELVAKVKQATVIAKSSGKYSGEVVIPASVVYNGTTYSVTSIGDNTFYYCSGLTSVTIPNSVTSIGTDAFYYCSGLTSVHISDIAAWCNIDFSKSDSNPLYYAHHLYLNGEEVKDLVIPNSVTSIGEYAFYGCSGLTSVTIPNSVTSIGDYAFWGCYRLTSVHISDIVAWCNIEFGFDVSNPLYYADHLYLNGEEVKDLVIPNSMTSIGNKSFYNFSGLTSVTIPNSVTSIGSGAFAWCSGLTSVHISDIAAWCNIEFGDYAANPLLYAYHLYLNGEEVKDLVIPNSVKKIGNYAFEGCSGLTSVTIPNSVTSIGERAFYNCSGLTSVTIPNSVTSIGGEAFTCCSGLTSVTIPNSVTSIGDGAFISCSSLTSVTIGNSVKSIGAAAFSSCNGLTSVTIPNSVKSIGEQAFSGCSGLTSVTIGSGVENIEPSAFTGCPKLLDVYCYAENVPSIDSYAFYGFDIENATLHVPAASVGSYKTTEPWSGFETITALEEDLTLADGEEFENDTELMFNALSYTRTLPNLLWNALYVPFEIPVTAEFLEDYDVAYFNDIHSFDEYIGEKKNGVKGKDGVIDRMEMEVLMVQEGATLNANYPYLIRAKNAAALNMNIRVEDAILYKAKETTVSCSSVFMKFDVTGIYTTQTAGELKGEFDVYAMSGGGWKQALNATQQLKPYRLYLKLTSIDGSPVKVSQSALSRINIRVDGEDTETGINELKTENANVKTAVYDLSGRSVQKAEKGLYIVNGKKVIK